MNDEKYAPQKKYLEKQKQLRVWVNAEKYEKFKAAVAENNTSIYALINEFVDKYISENNSAGE